MAVVSDIQQQYSSPQRQYSVASSIPQEVGYHKPSVEYPNTENTLPDSPDQFVRVLVLVVVEHKFERTAEQHLWRMTWQQQLEQLDLGRMSLGSHIGHLVENYSCGIEGLMKKIVVEWLVEQVDKIEFQVE